MHDSSKWIKLRKGEREKEGARAAGQREFESGESAGPTAKRKKGEGVHAVLINIAEITGKVILLNFFLTVLFSL